MTDAKQADEQLFLRRLWTIGPVKSYRKALLALVTQSFPRCR